MRPESKPLKIAVNTRLLLKNKLEGIGWFTYETLRRMVAAHPEVQWYFLFDRKPDASFLFGDNVHPMVLQPQARHPFLFYLWFEWAVPAALRKIGADLFLSPDGYISLCTEVPTLAVIHDLNFEHYPEDLPMLQRAYYRHYFPKFARKALRIATVSDFSRKDIAHQYGVDISKIDVVHNGVNEEFAPISENEKARIRAQYAEGCPYFLFVGALHPRKNLARLFEAFDQFKINDMEQVKLVVVGERKWWTPPIAKAYGDMQYRDDVVFTGRLQPDELRLITGAALASTYVSYFEGFGIPIVEAFRCGTPVITANATATADVGGDAALLVNPFSVAEIADAMSRVSTEPGLRQRLSQAGLDRSSMFSWDQAALQLWAAIKACLPSDRG